MKKIEYIKPEIKMSAMLTESLLDTTSLPTDNNDDNELTEEGDFLGNKGDAFWDDKD